MVTLSIRRRSSNADFQVVANSFLSDQGLPLAGVLPAVEIERIFRRRDALFGNTYNCVYNTALVLWAFLSQVLADGKMRSCAAAVARIADFLIASNQTPPSGDTGETALLREMLDSFREGDVLVADRYYCSFMMIALLMQRGVDACVRMHQRRHAHRCHHASRPK